MVILTKFPSYGRPNDLHSACGGCVGIDKLYPLSSWTCSKPAKITNKVVTVFMNVYQNCDFTWRWHNLEYENSDARAHEFNRSSRELSVQRECDDGLITKVEPERDIHTDRVTGDCVSVPAPPIITATETTPTSTAQAIRATTASDLRILSSHTSSPTTIGFSSSKKTFPINENTRGHSQNTSEPANDISATTITEGTESTTSESSTNLPKTPNRQTTDNSNTDSVTQTIHTTSSEALSQVSVSTAESTVSVTNISSPNTRPAGIRGSAEPSNNSQLGSGL